MHRIGIFGGSFDPVHLGHIKITEEFISKFQLDKCILVPTGISPFKSDESDLPMSGKHRIEMLKLVFGDSSSYEISDYESKTKDVNYTIDTLRHIQNLNYNCELFLLIGKDQAVRFNKWKDYKSIYEIASLVIADRYEAACANSTEEIIQGLRADGTKAFALENELINISSKIIRFRISQKLKFEHMVHPQIAQYIISNKLYLQ